MRKYHAAAQPVSVLTYALLLVCQATPGVSQQRHQPDLAKHEHLGEFLRKHLGEPTDETRTTRYSVAFVDLQDDGEQKAIVYLTGPAWCGSGGCTMLVLAPEADWFKVIKKMPAVLPPISVLTDKRNGWHDICIVTGRTLYEAVLSFNGKTYLNKGVRGSGEQAEGKPVISESTQDFRLYQGANAP